MSNILIPTTDEIDAILRRYRNDVYNRNVQEYHRALANNIVQSKELGLVVNDVITKLPAKLSDKEYTIVLSSMLFQAGLQVGLDIKRGYN